jgi:FkbM family methyltransferase
VKLPNKIIKIIDRLLGESLRKHYQVPSMEWSLGNMRRLGFDPEFIVDIGAYEGEWTALAGGIFPNAKFLMLDAQENKKSVLEKISTATGGRIDCEICLMGPEDGVEKFFHVNEASPTASSALLDQAESPTVSCKMVSRTLDGILQSRNLPTPGLLKLDVQGYELEVLKGASQTLREVQAVLLEVSIIELYRDSPLFGSIDSFMNEGGFCLYDICSLLRRPLDHALCQADAIYVKQGSSLLQKKVWQ